MPRNADETRNRLLEAATAEFADRGLAGARVDRIAESAGASKALLYTYFGNKEQLFDAVFARVVAGVVENVPIDADDLPGYAGRLFDLYQERPEILRLANWHMLERGPTGETPATIESNRKKVRAVEDARRAGRLPARHTAAELLALVLTLAATGVLEQPVRANSPATIARRRKTIVDAVARLVEP